MIGIGDADLVRVRSHEELRAGMTVVVKRCIACRVSHRLMLLRAERGRGSHLTDGAPCPAPVGWHAAPEPHGVDACWCFCTALAKGNLYRLRDLDDAEEEGRRIDCDIDDRRRAAVSSAVVRMMERVRTFTGPDFRDGDE